MKHYCRNPRCRSKLPLPVENEHHAFCTRGCHTGFYRSRCRVCERPLAADPMTGAKRCADGHRKYCGRKCASVARANPPDLPGTTPRKFDSRSAHFTGLKIGLAPIRGPARVLDGEVWGHRAWQGAVSSGGVAIQVSRLRHRALVDVTKVPLPNK